MTSKDPQKEIREKIKEIRAIEDDLKTMCELNIIESVDLHYIAHRIDDLKTDIRILKARQL